MAKVTMTFEDVPEGVEITFESDPPYQEGANPTDAQVYAHYLREYANVISDDQDDECDE